MDIFNYRVDTRCKMERERGRRVVVYDVRRVKKYTKVLSQIDFLDYLQLIESQNYHFSRSYMVMRYVRRVKQISDICFCYLIYLFNLVDKGDASKII